MYILSICRYIPISGYILHMRYVCRMYVICAGSAKCAYYPVYIQEYVDIRVIFTPNRLNFGYSGVRIPRFGVENRPFHPWKGKYYPIRGSETPI